MVQRTALETVRLNDDEAQLDATFVPGAGMICCSLRHRGQELLAQEGGLAEYEHDGHTMGIRLLYPWANRLAAFDYRIRGRTVRVPHDPELIQVDSRGLPIHGVIGGRVAWELTKTPADDGRSLSARLRWDESVAFDVFPFPHDVVYEARLAQGCLHVQVSMHASGDGALRLVFGFHPDVSLPGVPRERWQVELPAMRWLALDDHQIPDRTRPHAAVPALHPRHAGVRRCVRPGARAGPLRRGGRRPPRRGDLPRGLPLRPGVRPAKRALHLLRADGRAAECPA
jgi:aldose 1-epimerase